MRRPPWWRPRARRRWERAQEERRAVVRLFREHPELDELGKRLQAAFGVAFPTVERLTKRINEAARKRR